jgi:crooked neck
VRRNRINMNNWMRYAQWELEQKEYARARSIFERALDVDARSVVLWLRYIEAEMKTRNINHARNLLDRAVTILPRVDKLWYKYVYMEETLGNIPGTRQVFERWMSWEPDEAAWSAYIKLEKRYGEIGRARAIFQRLTQVHPEVRNWIKWARFEEEFGTEDNVREVFTTAIEMLGDEFMDEKLFIAYARYALPNRLLEFAISVLFWTWADSVSVSGSRPQRRQPRGLAGGLGLWPQSPHEACAPRSVRKTYFSSLLLRHRS